MISQTNTKRKVSKFARCAHSSSKTLLDASASEKIINTLLADTKLNDKFVINNNVINKNLKHTSITEKLFSNIHGDQTLSIKDCNVIWTDSDWNFFYSHYNIFLSSSSTLPLLRCWHDIKNGGIHDHKNHVNTVLSSKLISIIENIFKYKTPSPIQRASISLLLSNRNVLGISPTGSGKTFAYLLPFLTLHDKNRSSKGLAVSPSRELAIQIDNEMGKLLSALQTQDPSYYEYSCVCVVGGRDQMDQIDSLQKDACCFVSGTLGRLLSFFDEHYLTPNIYNYFIIDEIDRLLESDIFDDLKRFSHQISDSCLFGLFSATMPSLSLISEVVKNRPFELVTVKSSNFSHTPNFTSNNTTHKYVNERQNDNYDKEEDFDDLDDDEHMLSNKKSKKKDNQEIITNNESNQNSNTLEFNFEFIDEFPLSVSSSNVLDKIIYFLTNSKWTKCIIFCMQRDDVTLICNQIKNHCANHQIFSMHGGMNQSRREKEIASFSSSSNSVLVTTDVLGRGIHIDTVDFIMQIDLPTYIDNFIHRVGRVRNGSYKNASILSSVSCIGAPVERQHYSDRLLQLKTILKGHFNLKERHPGIIQINNAIGQD